MKYDAEPGKFKCLQSALIPHALRTAEFELLWLPDVPRPDQALTPHPARNARAKYAL